MVSTKTYTPQQFYKEFAGNDLKNDYVMLMNDPSREYYRLYEIDYDRHTYDGSNWTYINLPVDEIKKMAIESIKGDEMMYFSCGVGKFLDRERGTLDPGNYDYDDLFGVKFGMDKADRIRTFDSASSHAMTLVAVDLDSNGKPVKWMVENSWAAGQTTDDLIMTDRWFDEYMFRLVVNKKYVPPRHSKSSNRHPRSYRPLTPCLSTVKTHFCDNPRLLERGLSFIITLQKTANNLRCNFIIIQQTLKNVKICGSQYLFVILHSILVNPFEERPAYL